MVALWENVAEAFHHGYGGAGFVLRAGVSQPGAGGIRCLRKARFRASTWLDLWLFGTNETKKMLVIKNEPRMLFKISKKLLN